MTLYYCSLSSKTYEKVYGHPFTPATVTLRHLPLTPQCAFWFHILAENAICMAAHPLPAGIHPQQQRILPFSIQAQQFNLYPSILHILQNIAEVKRRKVIPRRFGPADHLEASVFFQQDLCRLQLSIVVIAHGKSVRAGIMNHK